MWVQREARLIGRTVDDTSGKPVHQRHKKPTQETAKSKTCQCEHQQYLPGLEFKHENKLSPGESAKPRNTQA